MKNTITLACLILVFQNIGAAQNSRIDSLRHVLAITNQDTTRVKAYQEICNYYQFNRPDSAIVYGYKGLGLARKLKFPQGEVALMFNIANAYEGLGNRSRALQFTLKAIKIAEENNLKEERAHGIMDLGPYYIESGDYKNGLAWLLESKQQFDSIGNFAFSIISAIAIANAYLATNQLDSALHYCQSVIEQGEILNRPWVIRRGLLNRGKVHLKKGNYDLALNDFRQALWNTYTKGALFTAYYGIAELYEKTENFDSTIFYAEKSLLVAQQAGFHLSVIDAALLLSSIYEKKDADKALEYSKLAITMKDSLYNLNQAIAYESLMDYDEQERLYEIEQAQSAYQNRIQKLWIFSISGALISALVLAIVLFRNYRNKQKANLLLTEQKEEIQSTLEKLEATQSQLIQSEKMASLGELTAGIAHEIQNPLNFVNNFSEVNSELIEELKAETCLPSAGRSGRDRQGSKLNPDINIEAVEDLINDILENEQKIKHHGKRAEAIVRGMLQHSRTSEGQKEPTDMNALADEYLRLAYHGLRAKDKSFNADFATDPDQTIPKINVIPQDIGRVLLNLINNAFQAVSEKAKKEDGSYKPLVTVTTSNKSSLEGLPAIGDGKAGQQAGGRQGGVFITVKDNGPGIPDNIRDKIFQPFFTTKPTGSGTGLGLSLSYDIIKAHGGELKLETKEGEGSEFIIHLPII